MNRSPTATPPESSEPSDEFVYDAFISYSHQDSTWVGNVLLPRLEGQMVPSYVYRRNGAATC